MAEAGLHCRVKENRKSHVDLPKEEVPLVSVLNLHLKNLGLRTINLWGKGRVETSFHRQI